MARLLSEKLTAIAGIREGVGQEMAIVVGSLAKLFVGELIDTGSEVLRDEVQAIDAMEDGGTRNGGDHERPPGLLPRHITEAVLRMRQEGKISCGDPDHYLFGKAIGSSSCSSSGSASGAASGPTSTATGASLIDSTVAEESAMVTEEAEDHDEGDGKTAGVACTDDALLAAAIAAIDENYDL